MQAYTQERTLTKEKAQAHAVSAEEGTREVETRFGKVTLQLGKAIHFPKGILGMPDKKGFCLTGFPMERFKQFKLLQSVEDEGLAFITLPLALENEFIQTQDIKDACATLSIPVKDVAILLIVTVHRRVNSISLSANVRAPLLIDAQNRVATQYVLPNNQYDIRHPISDAMTGGR